MEIVCHQTGYKAVINFKPYSWSNKELNKLDGYIYDNKYNCPPNWRECCFDKQKLSTRLE